MRKSWRDVLIFTAIAVFVSLVMIIMIRLAPKPPIEEVANARIALSLAAKKQADTYSKKNYNAAKIFYDSAMVNWQRENRRFLFMRDFSNVSKFARLSLINSAEAGENSISSSSNLKIKLKSKIDTLNNLTSRINALFTAYPLTSEIRIRISKGKMLLSEAEIAYDKELYLEANRKLTDSEYLLKGSYENATDNLKNYFKSYSTWKSWIDKTVLNSKRNRDYSIIIDKFSRKLFVYHNGRIKFTYNAELGRNWVGHKRIKGDQTTPEGMYKITKKFEKSKTKYYKALLLDYPNDEDMKNFKSDVQKVHSLNLPLLEV